MTTAAAQLRVERGCNLGPGRPWIGSKQSLGRHDDARQAVSALRGIGFDQGSTDGRIQAGGGFHVSAFYRARREGTRIRGLAIDEHAAGAALLDSAPEFGCHFAHGWASQDVEERHVAFAVVELRGFAIEPEPDHPWDRSELLHSMSNGKRGFV